MTTDTPDTKLVPNRSFWVGRKLYKRGLTVVERHDPVVAGREHLFQVAGSPRSAPPLKRKAVKRPPQGTLLAVIPTGRPARPLNATLPANWEPR